MTKREQLNKIDEAFYAISRALESGRDFDVFYRQNLAEERDHRRFVGRGFAISAPQAARLFCVKNIAEYLKGDDAPEIKHIFSFRLSVYQAFALVEMNREKLTAALKDFDLVELATAFDYAELVKEAA